MSRPPRRTSIKFRLTRKDFDGHTLLSQLTSPNVPPHTKSSPRFYSEEQIRGLAFSGHTFVWSSKLGLFSSKPTLRIRGDSTWIRVNDPSAGSPTETLLRLLLPLDDQVCPTSSSNRWQANGRNCLWTSLNHPIGSSDGRCVQRAGT